MGHLKVSISIVFSILICFSSVSNGAYSEGFLDDVAETVEYGESYEVAALPVVAILMAAGMYVARRSIVKTLTSQAASRVAVNYARGQMKRVGKKCFSVRGDGASRLILAMDKTTVLWAGSSHNIYDKKVDSLCH